MSKLIFGCGYLGARVARRWLEGGEEVHAVTRTQRRAEELKALGLRTILADVTNEATLQSLPPAETVLYSVGFDRNSGKTISEVYADGLRNALENLPDTVERVIYISSTGVYGQVDGDWVDEDSRCEPQREGGVACLAAERTLAEHPLDSRSVVLRLAGIYGPERIPRISLILAGQPIPAVSEGFLNLIHVDDAASIVLLCEQSPHVPRTYVVSDGHPILRRDYYEELARLLGAPAPRFEKPPPGSPAAARAESDKRINPRRLLDELHPQLRFPSYREGLAAIVKEGERVRR